MSHIRRGFHQVPLIVSLVVGLVGSVRAEVVSKVSPSEVRPVLGSIQISPDLQPYIAAMLEGSPTFRQQYERIISTPKLIINARTDMSFIERPFRARSCMRRYDSGLLVVSMDIAPGIGQTEWIAHEFEHVLEQLDGLSLPALVAQGSRGTWFSSDRMLETSRAMRAGRTVRDEMKAYKWRSDKFVH